MTARRRAVFLDRDGVLTASIERDGIPHPVATAGDLRILPGVAEACDRLRRSGMLLVCVTNQPDVARGAVARADVDATHERLVAALGLDAVLVCPHDDADGCKCRKPKPGLLLEAARRWQVDLSGSVMIGDRWRDVEAGRQVGCRTIFIDNGYAERRPASPDAVASDLPAAVALVLADLRKHSKRRQREMPDLSQLRVRIFGDGADRDGIVALAENPMIRGFTTNPTLMRAAGVSDYETFARDVIEAVPDHPISFEVFGDQFDEMERQALRIASWGENVYVKIPVTDTAGVPTDRVVSRLAEEGVKLNVTALMTAEQVRRVAEHIGGGPSSFISVFAGRIADTGRDPIPIMEESLEIMAPHSNLELIWASPREVLNILQADAIGCDVITVTHELLRKLTSIGKDLTQFSLETVQMFHRDAQAAGYSL